MVIINYIFQGHTHLSGSRRQLGGVVVRGPVVACAKVLGKLSVPGRPTNLGNCKARAYSACNRCGWELFGHFFSSKSFLVFLPL